MRKRNESGTIYFHSHKESGKVYVGQTWDYYRRTVGKAWDYRGSQHMFYAFKKYGWDAFDHQLITVDIQTQEEMDNLEKIWIILLHSHDRRFGYNLRLGGARGKTSEETREKMRIHGRRNNNLTKFRLGHGKTKGYTGYPANSGSFKPGQFKGKSLPLSQRQKMSAARKAWWDKKRGISCQS